MDAQAQESLVLGEYVMTAEDLRRISTMLHADSGIVMNEQKATLVYSRLAKRLRALGLESFRSYCKLVAGADGVDERQLMLSALTTNLTRFFREPHHFDDLRLKVLPRLVANARRGGRARIWSAGCSNGAEPYSVAMTLLSVMPDAVKHDIKILASDIDFRMVEAGREGVFEAEQLRDAPRELVARWMVPLKADGGPADGGRANGGKADRPSAFGAGEEMRALVSFRELNLIGDWPMNGFFDVIFCRNVAIYFDEQTQDGIWLRFADRLNTGGRLYIGHSERIVGRAQARFQTDGVTTYKLKSAQ